MKTQKMTVQLLFTEAILGGLPGNKDLLKDHILSKAEKAKIELTDNQKEEEVSSLGDGMEKGTTVFPKDDKGVFMWDYQVKGFLKEAAKTAIEFGDLEISKWVCGRVIDKTVFAGPRRIYFLHQDGTHVQPSELTICERPLRAVTMQGERVSIARSERIEAGVCANVEILVRISTEKKSPYSKMSAEVVTKLLDEGTVCGVGQWRNAGHGQFTWKLVGEVQNSEE